MQRYFRYSALFFMSFFFVLASLSYGEAAGKITAEDFSYQGIALGDSEEALRSKWGAPDDENVLAVWGIPLRTLTYGDIVVSTSAVNGKIVDINLIGEKYRLRKDVHYGSTSSYLVKIYGKAQRQFLDGYTCYIFSHPTRAHTRLILNLDAENKALVSVRMTMLPISEEEADALALSDDESLAEFDQNHAFIASKEIDVSELPNNDRVKLGGYVK